LDTLLTLEEVADRLRVSVRTVKQWANSDELPGGKVGGSWRFRRSDVEAWLDKQLTPHKHSKGLRHELTVQTLVNPANIFITDCETKAEFLNFFIDTGAKLKGISCRAEIADAVFKREKLMSTGIGLGLAVPHVRLNNIKDINLYIAVNQRDVADYVSLDGNPIRIGIFFVVGRDQHSEYIKALAIMLERLKKPLINEQVLTAGTPKDIYDVLSQEATR